ncbi:Mrp family chromosome partitioning ATPase [Amaricoccus macauensis]|jgi:Mrp family chromosome partitioning ATPase|uniref:Mrp family chromosome partitioning ATPase n=1 Tax=Amaricoccus macauensis TaxID=57001 RepID=A0A840SYY0_9RHOB|nr:CpsD/CapB family tyrosine-protein kinase [Amaricoccus macauensis]MBB5224413.1 Mrp family chromosome partitioning ATPase [Amaricoccus macauensis]
MERIQAAIQKAKEQRGEAVPGAGMGAGVGGGLTRGTVRPAPTGPLWPELAAFEPDQGALRRHHIVTIADVDPAASHFDILRTKILRTMRRNNWVSLGITSPTAGCGKTTMTTNIAFSLAQQPEVKTVLVDLDLRRPAIARMIGMKSAGSLAQFLQGQRSLQESFVRYGDNLAIGANSQTVSNSAELLMQATTSESVAAIKRAFLPTVILYDLPPMLQTDDAMAFLPHLDCVLLVAGAEKSRLDEVDKCEKDIAEQTNVLGVALNMCRYTSEEFGY